jgi:hypothetical protein
MASALDPAGDGALAPQQHRYGAGAEREFVRCDLFCLSAGLLSAEGIHLIRAHEFIT